MTHLEFIEELVRLRVLQLKEKLDGDLTGGFDEEEQVVYVYGHCRKVHPDLIKQYPHGWSMFDNNTIDETLAKLGLEIQLKEKP